MTLQAPFASLSLNVQAVPFRLRVLKNLTAVIENVNPINGFYHDLRGRVFRGRGRFGDDDPVPMVSILEAPIPQEGIETGGAKGGASGLWEILVQGFVEDDRQNPSDPAHHLMAEVKAVLVASKMKDRGHNALDLGGRVVEMFVGQGTVRPPDDPSSEVFFWLTLTLRLGEDLENPYV